MILMSEKRLIACGTLLKKYNEDFDIDVRAMKISVASDEIDEYFVSQPTVPYVVGFDVTAMTSAHLSNAFRQSVQMIESMKAGHKLS